MVKLISLLTPIYVTLFWGLNFLLKKKSQNNVNYVLSGFMLAAFTLYLCNSVYFMEFYLLYSFIDSIYILSLLSLYPLFMPIFCFLHRKRLKPGNTLYISIPL